MKRIETTTECPYCNSHLINGNRKNGSCRSCNKCWGCDTNITNNNSNTAATASTFLFYDTLTRNKCDNENSDSGFGKGNNSAYNFDGHDSSSSYSSDCGDCGGCGD